MGTEPPVLRVVFDTNTVVSALVFEGRLRWLRQAWRNGRLIPLVSRETITELIRVLAYPKFRLSSEEIELLLSDYLPYAEVVDVADGPEETIRCPDPDDQMFLDLAIAGGADGLVSGDRHLLDLVSAVPFEILTPAALEAMIESE